MIQSRVCVCVQSSPVSRPYRTTPKNETARRRRACKNTHGSQPTNRPATLHYTYSYSNSTVTKHPPNVTACNNSVGVGGPTRG